ncbi:MAG TPA: hypothetical protein VMQ65_03405 [Candidatus Limnocylindria bacterium]|nr:hypothetical protein [Candidatus Limnocylindria bacterium]
MDRIIELILSLLLSLGVGAPPGLGEGSTPGGPENGSKPPAQVEVLIAAANDRATAATEHARAVVAWAACVAEAARTAALPRDEDFNPTLGCGPVPAPPSGVLGGEEQAGAGGPPAVIPPIDLPIDLPIDVPPIDVPPLDVPAGPPADVPPAEIPIGPPPLPVEIPELP